MTPSLTTAVGRTAALLGEMLSYLPRTWDQPTRGVLTDLLAAAGDRATETAALDLLRAGEELARSAVMLDGLVMPQPTALAGWRRAVRRAEDALGLVPLIPETPEEG